ncbi:MULTISPECIES: lamin tail domain-containing protein [unclassified Brachybacterium]|uniref:lamin tail domain-containing protein n=1 Tax=unclassified Brachybacterium TaxID=2623841 RepID=UPI00402A7893
MRPSPAPSPSDVAVRRPTLHRLGALTGALALSAPLVSAVVLAPSAPAFAAPADVQISEVESDDPDGGEDWVELVNTGAGPVDLSGWFLKDDDDARDWTIPAGTVLVAGEHLVLDHADAVPGGFDFGLGKADIARLFAADGTTLIDSLAWTEHAPTSYIVIDGEVTASAEVTKGSANSGPYVPPPAAEEHPDAEAIRVTEVVSEGDDWAEIMNVSDRTIDLSAWYLLDEKDLPAEVPAVVPAGTELAPGERYLFQGMPFGLGKGDQARIFAPNGYLVDGTKWPEDTHAFPSWQRCGGGEGEFGRSHVATPGAPNACGDGVINETNSSGDDFVELKNLGSEPVDLSGHRILDSDDEHVHTLPAGTVLAPGALLLITGDELGYGLGGEDQVRLQDADGTLLGQVSWTEHVTESNALCDGEHVPSRAATPGEENDCGTAEPVVTTALPTDGDLTALDDAGEWGEDLSGLDLQTLEDGSTVLWGVNNDAGQISRLVPAPDGTWQQSDGWPTGGKHTLFADGTGEPDGEGVSVGADGRIYLSVERDNAAKGTSRNTVLAYDTNAEGDVLTAVSEWDLTSVLPATSANGGLEGIEMVPVHAFAQLGAEVPDAEAYAFVVLEDTGDVYALALQSGGDAVLVATLPSPLPGLMALDYDAASNILWAFADEALDGVSVQYQLGGAPVVASAVFARADGMPAQFANEGVALEPTEVCTDGVRRAWFADDADTDGYALRGIGLLDPACERAAEVTPEPGPAPEPGAGDEEGDEEAGEDADPVPAPTPSDGGEPSAASGAEGGRPVAEAPGGAQVSVSTDDEAGSEGARSGVLARTGVSAAAIAATALALVAGGFWLVRRARLA